MVVAKYLAAKSDEQMTEEMDAGNVTTTLQMLQSQSSLMKELESKLAGDTAISWGEKDEIEAKIQRRRKERELAELRMEIEENEALANVVQLIELAQGLGETDGADRLITIYRKTSKRREMKNKGWESRGAMDNWAIREVLEEALSFADSLASSFLDLNEELLDIREKINEQLAQFF
jgi:hypothetical protein